MRDQEQQAILREMLELLKLQMLYVRNLHDAFSALHDAVMRIDPRLKQFAEEEMQKFRPNDPANQSLSLLEALLSRLNKLE